MAVALAYRSAQEYQRHQVEGATPTELVLLLYDGAIRHLGVAAEQMRVGSIEQRHTHLMKAQRVIGNLSDTLDLERGGEVAANLQRVYRYMVERLVHANLYDLPEPIEEVVAMLRDLRASWEQVDAIERERAAASAPA